jgi:hypothetical protein
MMFLPITYEVLDCFYQILHKQSLLVNFTCL